MTIPQQVCEKCKPLFDILVNKIAGLQAKIDELEKRLLAYENAHTPSSQDKRKYPRKESSNNSAGAPIGHEGTTREMPKPNNFKELKLSSCPDCGKRLGRARSMRRKIIIDIPEPQPLIITEFTINYYFCAHCNKEIAPRDPGLPSEGIFGPNLLSEATLMKNEDRLPYNKIARTLSRKYNDLDLTQATALDINRRTADKLLGEYEKIKKEVMDSKQVNGDETGIKVQGKNFWAWIFTTLTSVLFMIRKNRGQKTIKEALGNNYMGILTCDGWASYPKCVKTIQRCWAHLLREAKWHAEKYEGQANLLYNCLCKMFSRIKKITINTAGGARARMYNKCINEMRSWINVCKSYPGLKKFAVKIENGLEQWFTCILHPEVEPTNNRAERELREIVVQRKISSLWNEKGIRIKEIVMSVLATWRLKGLNTFAMLRQTLMS